MPAAQQRILNPGAAISKTRQALGSAFEIGLNVLFGKVGPSGMREPRWSNQVALAALIIVALLAIGQLIQYAITRVRNYVLGTPWIVPQMKDAKQEMRISQNPDDPTSVFLRRSLNERAGIEFSYMAWLYVRDFTYRASEMRSVFHKGGHGADAAFSRCPGVYFAPGDNRLVVTMNTQESPDETAEIDNVPAGKWFHLALVLKERHLDIFINGLLKKRLLLKSLPKQNFGDLYVNSDGGFDGYLSRLRYFNYATSYAEIDAAVKQGPSTALPSNDLHRPPYLNTAWYFAP